MRVRGECRGAIPYLGIIRNLRVYFLQVKEEEEERKKKIEKILRGCIYRRDENPRRNRTMR